MRMPLPYFLLRRLGRLRPPRRSAAELSADPANMGTEFGMEASLVGWSDSFLAGRGDAAAPGAPQPQAADRSPARRGG